MHGPDSAPGLTPAQLPTEGLLDQLKASHGPEGRDLQARWLRGRAGRQDRRAPRPVLRRRPAIHHPELQVTPGGLARRLAAAWPLAPKPLRRSDVPESVAFGRRFGWW